MIQEKYSSKEILTLNTRKMSPNRNIAMSAMFKSINCQNSKNIALYFVQWVEARNNRTAGYKSEKILEISLKCRQQVYEEYNCNNCSQKKLTYPYNFVCYTEQQILANKLSSDTICEKTKFSGRFERTISTKTSYNYNDKKLLKVRNIDLQLKVKKNSNKQKQQKQKNPWNKHWRTPRRNQQSYWILALRG